MTSPAKDGNGAAASLLDKVQFFNWACEQHQLELADVQVLRVIVFKVLGLGDAKAHNGWCTANVLARMTGLTVRTVRRALDRLNEFRLVKTTGLRGRGGRTILHVPGVVGAENLLQKKLADREPDDDEPTSKIGRSRPIKSVENRTQPSAKIGRSRPMNPSKESLYGSESVERVCGGAANPPPGEPPALNSEDGEEGAFGGEGGTLTRPRQRLRDRVVGMASKLGLQDGGARFLRFATEVTVGDWLRLQREERDQRLVQAIWQALVDEYGLDAEEAGRLLASKAEPEPEPTPEPEPEPPAPAAKPPPPPASPLPPSPPRPPVWRARAGGSMAAALRQPEHKPEPRKQYTCSDTDMRASVERLKGYLS